MNKKFIASTLFTVVGAMALMGCNGGNNSGSKPDAKTTYTYNTCVLCR